MVSIPLMPELSGTNRRRASPKSLEQGWWMQHSSLWLQPRPLRPPPPFQRTMAGGLAVLQVRTCTCRGLHTASASNPPRKSCRPGLMHLILGKIGKVGLKIDPHVLSSPTSCARNFGVGWSLSTWCPEVQDFAHLLPFVEETVPGMVELLSTRLAWLVVPVPGYAGQQPREKKVVGQPVP